MSRLGLYINEQKSVTTQLTVLPLFHSCECYDSIQVFQDLQLTARHCKVFGEDLLYFFYGKPAYPAGEEIEGNRTDCDYCPVCFVVDPHKVNIDRVFPFDSGAFKKKKYKDFMFRRTKLEDYLLDSSLDAILDYITLFYTSNHNYIRGIASNSLPQRSPQIDGLIRLLHATGTLNIDERSHTVEVITKDNVQLLEAVECVILPEDLLRDDSVREFFDCNNILHLEYTVRALTPPSRYNEAVFDKVMDFLKARNQDGDL